MGLTIDLRIKSPDAEIPMLEIVFKVRTIE